MEATMAEKEPPSQFNNEEGQEQGQGPQQEQEQAVNKEGEEENSNNNNEGQEQGENKEEWIDIKTLNLLDDVGEGLF